MRVVAHPRAVQSVINSTVIFFLNVGISTGRVEEARVRGLFVTPTCVESLSTYKAAFQQSFSTSIAIQQKYVLFGGLELCISFAG